MNSETPTPTRAFGIAADEKTPAPRPRRGVRILVSLAVLAVAMTFLLAQIDFLRRHHPGISPARFLLPQVTHIWLPGLSVAAMFAVAARLAARRASK